MPANMASPSPSQQALASTSHAVAAAASGTVDPAVGSSSTPNSSNPSNSSKTPVPHIRIVPHLDAPRSLHFDVVDKDVPEGFVLKIGRFTDKQNLPNRITFRSKVVSRGHAEIFTEMGKFYIRDTKSSSGTFLNHARLSPPGCESKPTLLKDGDVVQLGVDYQGGTQEIYRCVKMRLEINRSWQQQANPFRANTLKVIKSLQTQNASTATDCCICLFRIASFQSLFVAPCSHIFHYKCIRPMLMAHHPGFSCPLCRTFADLEDSVEIDDPTEEEQAVENAIEASKNEVPTVEAVEPSQSVAPTEGASSSSSAPVQQQPATNDSASNNTDDQRQQMQTESSSMDQGSSSAISAPVPVSGRIIPSASLASAAPPMSPGARDALCAPTPPSDLAHTFQPPQRPVALEEDHPSSSRSRNATYSQERLNGHQVQQPYVDRDVTMSPAANDNDVSASSSPVPTAVTITSAAQPIPFSSSSPSRPRSASSSNLSSGNVRLTLSGSNSHDVLQQQPATMKRTRSPSASSASSPSTSNFLVSIMRSMSIPRPRTRSNSVNHTQLQQQQQGGSSSSRSTHGGSANTGDMHHDVYGKTLVPSHMPTGSMRAGQSLNSAAATVGSGGLGPVMEMDTDVVMEEEEQEVASDGGGSSSDAFGGDNSSSDGDAMLFGSSADAARMGQIQHGEQQAPMGCEVVGVGGNGGTVDELQRAAAPAESMTA